MSRNCSGVCSFDCAVTVALSICSLPCGRPPIWPAAISAFCALIAEMTSLGIRENAASRDGLSQMRIAAGAPNTLTSPTPGTRESGSWMFDVR